MSHTSYNPHQAIPLNMATPGETVTLIKIRGGRRMRKRLADLGLNIGMSMRVVQSGTHGPMLLAFKDDARLAIGQGITSKIIVTPYENDANH